MKNLTIKKLFFLLIGIGILVLIAYASASYYYTKSFVLESLREKSSNRAYRAAKKLSEMYDTTAYKYHDNEHLLRLSFEMAKEYFKKNGRNADLNTLKKNLEDSFGHLYFDIYIIDSEYVIQNTTYKPDMGLDFKLLPFALKVVDEVYKTPKMTNISHITNDTLANDYKVYMLERAPNEDYMIQLSMILKDLYTEKEFITNMSNLIPSLLRSSIYVYFPNKTDNKPYMDKLWTIDYKNKTKQKRINTKDYYKEFISLFDPDNKIQRDDLNSEIKDFIKEDQPKSTYEHNDNLNIQKIILPFQSYLNMQEKTGHILYLEFDESEAQEIIENMNIALYLVWISLFFIGSLFIYIINKHIINPISLIKSKMQKKKLIDELDLSNTNNEINSMVIIYNQLLRDLKREILSNEELLEEFKIFTQNTVHQVRTPVSVIKIALEMIQTDNKEAMLQIESSLLSMEHMYDSLSYALNQNNVVFEKQEINFSDLLNQRVALFSTIALAHDTKIEHDIQADIFLNLNQTEAEFLIDNNISNAIKYSTPKQPIRIRLLRASSDIILLFDSIGVQIEDKNAIFERYKRADKTKKGSGLGLNIVDAICKKNNILIKVEYVDGYNRFMYLFSEK